MRPATGRTMPVSSGDTRPDLATTSSAWVYFCGGKKMTDLAGVPFRRLLAPQGKPTVMFCADDTVFLPTVLQMGAG